MALKKNAKTAKGKKKEGIYSTAVRSYIPDLKKAKYLDPAFQAAVELGKRSYAMVANPSDEAPETKLKQTYRMKGKSGPKVRAPNVRDALYEWVVDVSTALKGRLPKTMLLAKAKQLQIDWSVENPNENYKMVCINIWIFKQ